MTGRGKLSGVGHLRMCRVGAERSRGMGALALILQDLILLEYKKRKYSV